MNVWLLAMKKLKNIAQFFWYSFAWQLLLLHFKKHQLLLIYWYILFATIGGGFMKMFGARALFLAPEYNNEVSVISAIMVGIAVSVFVLCWNITTFILHSKHIKFLATASRPFVQYCLNNSVIPLLFLSYYLYHAIQFGVHKELFNYAKMTWLIGGFCFGLVGNLLLSFTYFFKADSTIQKNIKPILTMQPNVEGTLTKGIEATTESSLLKARWYFTTFTKIQAVRQVQHYNKKYLDLVFSRHHLAAIFLLLVAFFFVVVLSFFIDNPYFQLPAAASLLLLFAILLSVFSALSYFLQNWSLPFFILVIFGLNVLYQHHLIDPTNKAYGLNYTTTTNRPAYNEAAITSLCTPTKVTADSMHMIGILNAWKAKQTIAKPNIYLINVSGGGSRSASFSYQTLLQLDSTLQGQLLNKTMLVTGASGGMLGAAYYRAIKHNKIIDNTNGSQQIENISKDLLNPIFSSFVARDVISPAQKFSWQGQTYTKDRAYAFEQQLNDNTNGLLNITIGSYAQDEANAQQPILITNSVVLRDARKMMVCTQPISYLMQPCNSTTNLAVTPDAIDFTAYFAAQNPLNLRLLTALRMNATFPYILPTVWLPTNPVISVMDAGIKDNYGLELTIRYVQFFRQWLVANCNKVVIISIRDRKTNNWDVQASTNNMLAAVTHPATQLQYNIFKIQDYEQNEKLQLLGNSFGTKLQKVVFQYAPTNTEAQAPLSFHLTNSEKRSISQEVVNTYNQQSLQKIKQIEKLLQ